MNENRAYASGGGTLLLIAFIVLKLTHVIDWSWWWVLSPMWIPVGLGLIAVAVYIIAKAVHERKRKYVRR